MFYACTPRWCTHDLQMCFLLLCNAHPAKHEHPLGGTCLIWRPLHICSCIFFNFLFDMSMSVCACCSLSVCLSACLSVTAWESAHASNQDISCQMTVCCSLSPLLLFLAGPPLQFLCHMPMQEKKRSLAPHSGGDADSCKPG